MPSLTSHLFHRALTRPVSPTALHRSETPAGAPQGSVRVAWLGTAGVSVTCQGRTLLLDPYLSRPGLRRTLASRLSPRGALVRRHLRDAEVVVCSHSHFDHILDVPEVARLTGAEVVGSASSAAYCRSWGLPHGQVTEVKAPATLERGPFRITLRRSLHGKGAMGRVPLQGKIPPGVRPPLRARQMLSDETFAVLVEVDHGGERPLRVFHLGSAAYLPGTLEGLGCDLLMPCLLGRKNHPRFTEELVRSLRPSVVVPIHFDDFFAPLDRPLRAMPGADLPGFSRELAGADPACRLVVLDLLGALALRAQ